MGEAHVAIVKTTDSLRLFMDGVLQCVSDIDPSFEFASGNLYLGHRKRCASGESSLSKITAKQTAKKVPETKITAKQTAKNNAKSSPVTKEEIDTIRKQIRVKIKDNRAALKNIFAKLDKDKSDSLSKKEFGKLILAVMKKAPSKAVLKEIWKDASRSTTLTVLEKEFGEKKEINIANLTEWIFM